jgi:hypothetical protein
MLVLEPSVCVLSPPAVSCSLLSLWSERSARLDAVRWPPVQPRGLCHTTTRLPSHTHTHTCSMAHLDANTKHHILLEYSPHGRDRSFAALALRHQIAGGARTVQRWYSRWDGKPQSLQEGERSGRPRVLSKREVTRHVTAPIRIRNSNRAARPVRYPKLLPQVQAATGKELSLRTLQRYGHEEAGGRQTRGKKRTAQESEPTQTCSTGV